MKFCKDCIHLILAPYKDDRAYEFARCEEQLSKVASISPVTGKPIPQEYLYADLCRKNESFLGEETCGKEARYFEPIEFCKECEEDTRECKCEPEKEVDDFFRGLTAEERSPSCLQPTIR